MKLLLKIVFGVLIAGIILAPAAFAQRKVSPTAVTISGKINLDDNYVAIISDLRGKNKEAIEIPISKSGVFSWKSTINSTGFVRVSFIPKSKNRQLAAFFPLYVAQGTKLQLNLSYSDSTYLSLLPGNLSGENTALIQYSNFTSLKLRDMFKNKPSSVNDIKSSILPYLETADNYIGKFGVKNEIVKQYLNAWAMNNYLSGLYSLPHGLKVKDLPADYYTIPKSPEVVYNNDVAMLLNETYMNVNQYINTVKKDAQSKDAFEQLKLKFKTLNDLFTNKQLMARIVTGNIEELVRKYTVRANGNFEDDLIKYKELVAYVNDEGKRAELIKDFENLKYTMKGAKLPDVAFKTATGNTVKLQSFEGKYIYIDLWASWCKPCVAEIPALHQLETDYKDKNIVFVSISLDADKDDWKSKMAELKLEGNQLELGDSAYDKLMNVAGIPHFLLYDPTGKLIMYKAPRPGTKEIRTMFDQLLQL
ncbi:Thiol:disulfide interchange protein TlpA [compost metagenome]